MTNMLFIGKVYKRFDELGSTNDYALDLLAEKIHVDPPFTAAKSKPVEGMVIRADRQSAGRGQFGSVWESEGHKNLMISVILYPTWLAVQDQFYLSMAVALALHDAVHISLKTNGIELKPKVKWPNDLYFGTQKVAGILIQNAISGHQLQSSVVGIGLNINQSDFGTGLPNATSMYLQSRLLFDIDRVGDLLFECLEQRYLLLKTGKKSTLKSEYEANLLGFEQIFRFENKKDQSIFEGTIKGVAPSGQLMIETSKGELVYFDLKEVGMV